jgi:molybdopterin/thiamine biosynthesis adenylyltransferase
MDTNYEKQKEELRNSLSAGGFGFNDDALFTDDDADESIDDNVINAFVNGFGSYKHHDYVAHIPSKLLDSSGFCGYVHGIARKETETFYVIDSAQDKYPVIGFITDGAIAVPDDIPFGIIIIRTDDGVVCKTTSSNTVRIKPYDEQVKLFSRNSGLLESSWMLDKCVILIGCGSVGSFIALQLARSGVGKFVLCDTDTLEIHNICRHQCGFNDLGRYKVDAVRDKILNINPKAEVTIFRTMIQRTAIDSLLPFLGSNSIVIGTGDNRESSRYACDNLAIPTGTSFVSTCCWTRAYAGEVIYWTPGKNLPCYQCALGDLVDSDDEIERAESNINYFGSDKETDRIAFEPGIAVDIDFVSIIAVKIILDLINKDNPNYTPRVINYLTQFTWICNTNEPKVGGEKAGMFSHPLKITKNLHFRKKDGCAICGGND